MVIFFFLVKNNKLSSRKKTQVVNLQKAFVFNIFNFICYTEHTIIYFPPFQSLLDNT